MEHSFTLRVEACGDKVCSGALKNKDCGATLAPPSPVAAPPPPPPGRPRRCRGSGEGVGANTRTGLGSNDSWLCSPSAIQVLSVLAALAILVFALRL